VTVTSPIAPPRSPQRDPEALIAEARERQRRRRRRLALLVGLLAVAGGVAFGLGRGSTRGGLVRAAPGGPLVDARAFAGQGELAFVSKGVLWLLAGGGTRRLGGEGPRIAGSPAFSPDGKWLAYLETAPAPDAPSQLWLARAGGSGAHEVAGLAVSALVGWSPRRDVLAVIAGPPHAGRCPCGTSTTLRLVAPGGAVRTVARSRWLVGAAWSPDGRALVAGSVGRGDSSTLASYPAGGGAATVWLRLRPQQSLDGERNAILDPAGWWPGRGVGFWIFGNGAVDGRDGSPLLQIAAAGARPRLLGRTLSDGTTDAIAAAPGGRLAIVADHGGGRVIWQGKTVETCPAAGACTALPKPSAKVTVDPAWSPDGTTLAYIQAPELGFPGWPQRLLERWYDAHGLRLYDAATGRTTPLPRAQGATALAWSRDGKELLYAAHDGIWLLPALGAAPVEIAAPIFPRGSWPAYYGQIGWQARFAWSGAA
jgi:WD40-like Beta Propeller Repeat